MSWGLGIGWCVSDEHPDFRFLFEVSRISHPRPCLFHRYQPIPSLSGVPDDFPPPSASIRGAADFWRSL